MTAAGIERVRCVNPWAKVIKDGFDFRGFIDSAEFMNSLERDPLELIKLYVRDKSILIGSNRFVTLKEFRQDLSKFSPDTANLSKDNEQTRKWWKLAEVALAQDERFLTRKGAQGGIEFCLKGALPSLTLEGMPAGNTTLVTPRLQETSIPVQKVRVGENDEILDFFIALQAGRDISKASTQRILREPLLLAHLANSKHARRFSQALNSLSQVQTNCGEVLGALLRLTIPRGSSAAAQNPDQISSKTREELIEKLKPDLLALFKRSFDELSSADGGSLLFEHLLSRMCFLVLESETLRVGLSRDPSTWARLADYLASAEGGLETQVRRISQENFARFLTKKTDTALVKSQLNEMREIDIFESEAKQKLYSHLSSLGLSESEMKDAWAATSLSSWLTNSRTGLAADLSKESLNIITTTILEKTNFDELSYSDFGLYVNASPRISELVPDWVAEKLFEKASQVLPVLSRISERFSATGAASGLQNLELGYQKQLKAQSHAIDLLTGQISQAQKQLENERAALKSIQNDFQRQVDTARQNLVFKLAESLAQAVEELERQFGLATVDQAVGRILSRMRALRVERMYAQGDLVAFDPNLHECEGQVPSRNESVLVTRPGFKCTLSEQEVILIKTLVTSNVDQLKGTRE